MNSDIKKNTTPESYDENTANDEIMTQEEILMNENDILAGLLELDKTKNEIENYRKIQIKRSGVLKLEFRIRPVTEDEIQSCMRSATKYAPVKPGQPKKALDTNRAKYRSYLLYTATVDEDRAKIWDNKKAQMSLNILESVDMIDRILLAGEKDRILDMVDEISGFNDEADEAEENAKN